MAARTACQGCRSGLGCQSESEQCSAAEAEAAAPSRLLQPDVWNLSGKRTLRPWLENRIQIRRRALQKILNHRNLSCLCFTTRRHAKKIQKSMLGSPTSIAGCERNFSKTCHQRRDICTNIVILQPMICRAQQYGSHYCYRVLPAPRYQGGQGYNFNKLWVGHYWAAAILSPADTLCLFTGLRPGLISQTRMAPHAGKKYVTP